MAPNINFIIVNIVNYLNAIKVLNRSTESELHFWYPKKEVHMMSQVKYWPIFHHEVFELNAR